MISRIFLDIDDVLNTFTIDALWCLGCGRHTYSELPITDGYPLFIATELFGQSYGFQEMWDAIPRNLWANSKKSTQCDWLLETSAQYVGRENVFLATSVTKDPDCLAGKLEWIVNYLPNWIHRQYFMTPRKWLLAQPETLLIDDCEQNIEKFVAGGGNGIVFPQPWNTKWGTDATKHIDGELRHLFLGGTEC